MEVKEESFWKFIVACLMTGNNTLAKELIKQNKDIVMKVNDAPEKIYLQVCGDCPEVDCRNCKFEDLEDNITWCKDKIFEKDVEYTRTDAFIEKACEWLESVNLDFYQIREGVFSTQLVEDFRKYMKGGENDKH